MNHKGRTSIANPDVEPPRFEVFYETKIFLFHSTYVIERDVFE